MAKEGNWQPGETVPRTGTYKCIFCGPDGMAAQALKIAMRGLGRPYTPPPQARVKPPYRFFNEGDTFPSCPNCGADPSGADATGWNFVSEKKIKGEGCFIATACCGSAEAPEVAILRRYRDTHLLPRAAGRLAVRLYYRSSPPLAAAIRRRPRLGSLLRRLLVGPLARWARARMAEE